MGTRNHAAKASIPGWSWAIGGIGLALVVGSAGFMTYQGFAGDMSPPAFEITPASIAPQGNVYLVEIGVTNRGGSVAANVMVEGLLKDGAITLETSTVTLTYVPAGSERSAGLIFDRDPGKFQLTLRVKGYEKP